VSWTKIRLLVWGGTVVALAALGIVMYIGSRSQMPVQVQNVAEVGGPFTLTDQHGQRRSWEEFRGKATAVFFGFTHCPEICPSTLFELSQRLGNLGDDADRLSVLLISADPARDTPEKLKQYLQSFDPRIVALTGTEAEVDTAVQAFRAYRKMIPLEGEDYTVDHSALVYLFDKKGRFLSTLDRHEPAEAQQAKLARAIGRGS
jgi:protein SCO1